jgi:predicted transcriptional regulator
MSRGRKRIHQPRSARATVSIAPDTYQTIQAIAKQKKVSTAWVIRDAVDKYVAEQWPLLQRTS